MKVRMIFGSFVPNPDPDKADIEHPAGTTPDLDDATAKALIEEGRAEPIEPAEPPKKGK
jgi:hypothetical protein